KAGKCPIEFGGKQIVYKLHEAHSYSNAGRSFTEMYTVLARKNCVHDSLVTIGIYYDEEPKTQTENDENASSKCRYIVGVLLSDDDHDQLQSRTRRALSENGYKLATLPNVDHVVHSTFPFRGSVSIVVAVRRVYPLLDDFIKRHNLCAHPYIEIYKGDKIYFILPLAKQDQFYFCEEDEVSDEHSEANSSQNGSCDEQAKDKQSVNDKNNGQSGSTISSQSS
ncbi:hypothetical protein B4U79_14954, partial [Dinothrombium tinctorium]